MSQSQQQNASQQNIIVRPDALALHSADAARFWEERAKVLQHLLLEAHEEIGRLRDKK